MAALAAATAFGLASCAKAPSSTSTSGTGVVMCDNSFENIMMQEVDVFEYKYPEAHILTRYCTTAEAVDSLMAGNVSTVVIPRELSEGENAQLKLDQRTPRSMKIAVDAVALIVNPDNPAQFLTMPEIKTLLTGEVTNWQRLDPTYDDKPVQIVFDDRQSSLIQYMSDKLLDGGLLGSNARQAGSIQEVINTVRKDKSAIGVIGVSWLTSDLGMPLDSLTLALEDGNDEPEDGTAINTRLTNSGVKVLGVWKDGEAGPAKPFQQNIYDGSYPLTRSIYMITTAYTNSIDGGFYSFVTGVQGQKLIMKTGVMPARAKIEVNVELVQ